MNIIRCEDCGAERKARYKNTKYCRVCRMARNVDYLAQLGWRASKCNVCDVKFAPLKRNDQVCPKCSYIPQAAVVGVCALCDTEAQWVDKDVAVCYGCATDPDKRDLFQRALRKKVIKRAATPNEELRLPPEPPKAAPLAPAPTPDI